MGTGRNSRFIHGSRNKGKHQRLPNIAYEMPELSKNDSPFNVYVQVQYKQEKLDFTGCHYSKLSLHRQASFLVPLLYLLETAG